MLLSRFHRTFFCTTIKALHFCVAIEKMEMPFKVGEDKRVVKDIWLEIIAYTVGESQNGFL